MPCLIRSTVLVACVALVGCSSNGSSGAGGGSGGNLTFTQFCTQYTDTVAGQISTCNGGPKELWTKSFSEIVRCGELGNAIDAGRAAYDPAFAQPCITAAAGFSCSTLLASPTAPDCVKALNGKIAVGGTCYGGIDCGEGKYCATASGACSGTCKTQIAAGAACGVGDDCVRGYYCSASVCTLNPPDGAADIGASCTGGVKCKPGLTCDRVTNNCAKPIKEGQPCVFGHGLCEFFTSCASASNTCVRFSSAGGPCGVKRVADGGLDYENSSCLDSFCKIPSGSTTGTCVVLLADMAVCAQGDECTSGICTASKCAPRCVIP